MSKTEPKLTADVSEAVELLTYESLAPKLRDILLAKIKLLPKPWAKMSETEQRGCAFDVDADCKELMREAVRLIASEGRRLCLGTLEQVTIKDGIKCVVMVPSTEEGRHDIFDSQGQFVYLVVADASTATRDPEGIDSHVQKDQKQLDLDGKAGNDADMEAAEKARQDNEAETTTEGENGGDDNTSETGHADSQATEETGTGTAETEAAAGTAPAGSDRTDDQVYNDCITAMREKGVVSQSMLQRVVGISWNRAARMITRLEAAGLITGVNADGKRDIVPIDRVPAIEGSGSVTLVDIA